jgi:hypothetical protein
MARHPKWIDAGMLQPGDALLYRPTSPFGWGIAIKTYTWISHIEVYKGNGWTVASRDGKGVDEYELRDTDVARVLRPTVPCDMAAALRYFRTVQGEKYDFKAILCFLFLSRSGEGNRQICSEFAANFYRHGRLTAFSQHWPADRTAPADFVKSPAFTEIYHAGKLF